MIKLDKPTSLNLKRLTLFFFAVISLLISGSLISQNLSLPKILVFIIGALCGVVLIYDSKGINRTASLKIKIKQFLTHPRQAFFLFLLIALTPAGYIILSPLSFFLFVFAGALGVGYSITIKRNNLLFRLKNVLILKNLLIGMAWGILVLIGAGSIENKFVLLTSLFAFIQVFIGSVIRDLPDREKDMSSGVRSIPASIGEAKTILVMHLINLFSLIILFIPKFDVNFIFLIVIIVFWRLLNLIKVKADVQSNLWGQTINLFTCYLFFIISLIQFLWN